MREEPREAGERARKEAEQLRGCGRVWELCRASGGKGKRWGRRETKPPLLFGPANDWRKCALSTIYYRILRHDFGDARSVSAKGKAFG